MSDTPRTDAKCMSGETRYTDMVHCSFAQQLERELASVTHERDKWKAKYVQQNKDLGCEMMDPNGTIWDHAAKVQQQRDRLAEALQLVLDENGVSYLAFESEAREALAAVKGDQQ